MTPTLRLAVPAGSSFACLPGCGFCCTTSPGLDPSESDRLSQHGADASLARHLVERADGSLGLRLNTAGTACAALDEARRCGAYEERPRACRAFPVHVHAAEAVQATVNLACPGLDARFTKGFATVPTASVCEATSEEAQQHVEAEAFDAARENWREFRRRLQVLRESDPGVTRKRFEAILPRFVDPRALAAFYALLADGRLDAAKMETGSAWAALEAGDELPDLAGILRELAAEAFTGEEPLPLHVAVERDARAPDGLRFEWWTFEATVNGIARHRVTPHGKQDADVVVPWLAIEPEAVPEDARAILADHLRLVLSRDHCLGHAARVMDATGYEVTYAAALGRVLADAAAGLLLRTALFAGLREGGDGIPRVRVEDALEAVRCFDLAHLSEPSIGAVF